MVNIIFPKGTEKYAALHCNNVLTDYTECPEIESVREILQSIHPKSVLEIGAGLGRVSVFLRHTFDWDSTDFYLVDGDSGEEQIVGINSEIGPNYYNSLKMTRVFCLANGISEDHLCLINSEKSVNLGNIQFDLCYSFKSIGFHWAINAYLDKIYNDMKPGAYLMFELRNEKNWDESRWERIRRYVQNQIDGIDRKKYIIYKFNQSDKFPVLVLVRQ